MFRKIFFTATTAMMIMNSAFAEDTIIVQSTTSTKNSGLYDYILPVVKADTGITVNVSLSAPGPPSRMP